VAACSILAHGFSLSRYQAAKPVRGVVPGLRKTFYTSRYEIMPGLISGAFLKPQKLP